MNNTGETKKKILVLLGRPRKKGNSTTLAMEIAEGAESEGAEVETLYINGMNIRACQACWTCQEEKSAGCPIDDDMQIIYPKLAEADCWVIASPVHWFNMSTQTKLWLDRCFALQKYGKNPFKKRSPLP
ncbi:MAG: flavodoxin family protein [Deltaproteobacteria bacterium]|nr:flavodoxin family protein [Deltaproteobacteria bacterium]MBW2111130.1 flavodoxin family protein [Deltaproteobacteria bacterium]MBW2353091.1 flavodoxin family protein [Deltaproteobacteria bacterium]